MTLVKQREGNTLVSIWNHERKSNYRRKKQRGGVLPGINIQTANEKQKQHFTLRKQAIAHDCSYLWHPQPPTITRRPRNAEHANIFVVRLLNLQVNARIGRCVCKKKV